MVFNSLFAVKETEESRTQRNTRDNSPAGDGLSSQNDQPDNDQGLYGRKRRSEHAEAEARILKAVSNGSIHASDDENWSRIAGFSLGLGSLYVQEVLTYPLCAVRRQCQVNHTAMQYHLTPFTLFRLLLKIQKNQGMGALWKGWGTSCVVQGLVIFTEVGISEVVGLPKDLSKEEKIGLKKLLGHEILKCLGLIITLPFYSASLVDSVQSHQLNEARSLLDFLKDVFYRLAGWYQSRGHGRLLPMYFLIAPTLLHSMLHYVIKSFIERAIIASGTKSDNSKLKEDISIQAGKTYYIQLLAGFISSVVTDLLLFPLETVVIRLHVQGTRTIIDDTDTGDGVVPLCTNYDGIADCAKTICREEGVSALFKGLGALCIQFFLRACVLKITKAVFKGLPQPSEESPNDN